jgi:hypothetical protein
MSDEVIAVICIAPIIAVVMGLLAIWISFELDKTMDDQDD